MPTHPLLHSRRVIALLGVTFGAGIGLALAASPVAGADAIDDAWPYLSISSTPYPVAKLPGELAILPTASNGNIATYTHHLDPVGLPVTDGWYTAHETISYMPSYDMPILGSASHSEVAALLDGSPFPHVGTTVDELALFPFTPVQLGLSGVEPLFINSYLNDPIVGFADAFTVQGFFGNGVGLTNTFISDAAGFKDVLSFEGQPPFLTLFELPTVEPDSASADLSQLMADFNALF
ncbi:hypothetical protein [[Mycobacterium] crassicus]|uniref:PE-PPE domain-containing protein n=1 Tax=[Mycobacterium] crassicus TaxID=2872309 RepID=A0ABU5XKW2_9MYCO|nr:hypothetical protein [Mycolicibacter sp. MYC098]MEB3021977.1 hypothetical protein [Mycolicibacter sp. MYC098]